MTGRLNFDPMPEELPEKSRRAIDASFRTVRSVLDGTQGGIRMREQFAAVLDIVIDTDDLPTVVRLPLSIKRPPLKVELLKATVQRTTSGQSISGAAVHWEYRNGGLLIHEVASLDAATRYDATIAVME